MREKSNKKVCVLIKVHHHQILKESNIFKPSECEHLNWHLKNSMCFIQAVIRVSFSLNVLSLVHHIIMSSYHHLHWCFRLHNRSPPPQTDEISETPDTFLQDSTPTLTISSLEQKAASASHTQMTFEPEDTEHLTCVFISPQIAEQESTSEVQQTALIEPIPTESPASPPDTSDTLLTSQQSNTEVSQILHSPDTRYMLFLSLQYMCVLLFRI